MDFTLARFIRIRLQGMHTTKSAGNNIQWLVDHTELNKRSFYSLKFIKIGARLECNGHARAAKQYGSDEVSRLENMTVGPWRLLFPLFFLSLFIVFLSLSINIIV